MSDTSETPGLNGVNVEHLLGARNILGDQPEAGQFTWRVTNEWLHGTHSKTQVEGYFGLGQENDHKASYSFESDHPLVFAAEDNAATPVEIVLTGPRELPDSGCRRGRTGAGDPAAFSQGHGRRRHGHRRHPGRRSRNPERVPAMSRSPTISTPTPRPTRSRALVAQSQKRSAVYDILTNPTNVTVEVK